VSDRAISRRRRLAAARLYFVAPARLRAGRLADLIPSLARAGVDMVQLRDRDLSAGQLREELEAVVAAADAAGILSIVNDDPELARAVGADGVHLGQGDGRVEDARALLGPDALIGRSTRGRLVLDAAASEGADYASVGPLWATPTKPGREPIGLTEIPDAAHRARLPWFAIGGLDSVRIGRAAALGARRAVVVRAIAEAQDPAAAAADLRARLVEGTARVMTVAGSDSGGGAGIQADIKAISRAGGFPTCAVTALTAQNTLGVHDVMPVRLDMVGAQVAAIASDVGVDGVKTGMLGTPELVEAVASALAQELPDDPPVPVVVDTVLRAESGASLMAPGGEDAIRRSLLPLATVMTPNLLEAQALADLPGEGDAEVLARTLSERHGCAALVTGGHGPTGDDILHEDGLTTRIPGVRLARATNHGSGCTHSATLATLLARGFSLADAARGAKDAATGAVAGGRPFGGGAGPVDVTNRPRLFQEHRAE
jgi:hydroxymethylpyrimidine kinase/phosphomethylpyrimidine kinase/thiamine-phosphate diphosphorylase